MGFSVVERSKQVKINPLTTGKRNIITCMSPPLCARQCFGAFPHSFDSHSNPEKKVVFPLFFQMRLRKASGVSKLREQGRGRVGVRSDAQPPRKPACLGMGCDLTAMGKDWGGLESELPGGAYLYQCPGNCTCNSFPWSSAFCNFAGGLSGVPVQIYELVHSTSTLQQSLEFPEDSRRDHNYLGSKLPLSSSKQMSSIFAF